MDDEKMLRAQLMRIFGNADVALGDEKKLRLIDSGRLSKPSNLRTYRYRACINCRFYDMTVTGDTSYRGWCVRPGGPVFTNPNEANETVCRRHLREGEEV